MSADWENYQEEAAAFFRSIGLNAEVNASVQGIRTAHKVDVLAKSVHAGFEIIWLVECKYWKTPVNKLHVLGLRQIVIDVGADRGILLSEEGFQSGAIEAANLTNVQLTSLAELRVRTKHDISAMRFRELFDRVEACKGRYWKLSKRERIDRGLRPDVGEGGYSCARVSEYCKDVLTQAMRGRYPFTLETIEVLTLPHLRSNFRDPTDVEVVVDQLILDLEKRLSDASA